MIPKVFIDTNVWFSSFWGSENSQRIIKAHINGVIKGVISEKVLDELINNLHNKLPQVLPSLKRLIVNSPPEIIKNPSAIPLRIEKLVDKKDQLIFVSAVRSNSDYFVTGNIKDFSIEKLEKLTKIKIVTPNELLKKLKL